jgi:hypothetical protein
MIAMLELDRLAGVPRETYAMLMDACNTGGRPLLAELWTEWDWTPTPSRLTTGPGTPRRSAGNEPAGGPPAGAPSQRPSNPHREEKT